MRKWFLLILAPVLALGMVSCTANRSERSEMDRAMKSMDDGNYAQAQQELQAQLNEHPGDPKLMILLAEADLGLSGIRLLDFLQTISAAQPVTTDFDLLNLPACDSGKIEKFREADIRCILLRMVQHLPDPDDSNFAAARDLLETAYGNAKSAPTEVNFLTSVIDLTSAMSRAKILIEKMAELKKIDPKSMTREDFHFTVHQLKNEIEELDEGFKHARYSYQKISHFVVSMDGKPVIKIGNNELVFGEDIDLPTFLRFAKDVVVAYRDNIDDQLNISLSESLEKLAPTTMLVFEKLDRYFSLGFFYDNILDPSVAFEQAMNDILDEISNRKSDLYHFDLLELAWKHPPKILKPLPQAFSKAWAEEDIDPLNQYYLSTQTQWLAFKKLTREWDRWIRENTDEKGQHDIIGYLRHASRSDERMVAPQADQDYDSLRLWQSQFVDAFREHATEVLLSQVDGLPQFNEAQQRSGMDLLNRTLDWVTANLWSEDESTDIGSGSNN